MTGRDNSCLGESLPPRNPLQFPLGEIGRQNPPGSGKYPGGLSGLLVEAGKKEPVSRNMIWNGHRIYRTQLLENINTAQCYFQTVKKRRTYKNA